MTDLAPVFRRVHRQLRPRTPIPEVATEFFPSVGANHSATLDDGRLRVRISDLFVDAPEEVSEALAAILLSKLYGKKVDPKYQRIYRRYTLSPVMQERGRQARTARGRPRPRPGPSGHFYHLEAVFDTVNRNYFDSELPKPHLSWTPGKARSVLGRYDFHADVIFVSRFLDRETVPEYVIQYIVFHEMLHVKHGTEVRESREIVHSAAFRREERQFEHFEAANRWLDSH